MRILKRYRFTLIALLPVLVLIMVRYLPGNHFHPAARQNANPALRGENLIHADSIDLLSGNYLLLGAVTGSVYNIQPLDLSDQSEVKKLKKFRGKIILMYKQPSDAAIAWMILAQQGVKDLHIADIGSGEEFNYQFRPVSVPIPEGFMTDRN